MTKTTQARIWPMISTHKRKHTMTKTTQARIWPMINTEKREAYYDKDDVSTDSADDKYR